MPRFLILRIAVVSLISMAGCTSEPLKSPTTEVTLLSKSALGADQEIVLGSLAGKRRQIAELQERLDTIDRRKLSYKLRTSLGSIRLQLETERERLAALLTADAGPRAVFGSSVGFPSFSGSGSDTVGGVSKSTKLEVVLRGRTYLRGGPGRSSLNIMMIEDGTAASLVGIEGDWVHVRLSNPKIDGYVFGDFVVPKADQAQSKETVGYFGGNSRAMRGFG